MANITRRNLASGKSTKSNKLVPSRQRLEKAVSRLEALGYDIAPNTSPKTIIATADLAAANAREEELAAGRRAEMLDTFGELVETAKSAGRDDEIVVTLLRASADALKERHARRSTMTDEQADVLIESGVFTRESLAAAEERVAAGELDAIQQRSRMRAISQSMSARLVAQTLGIDESRVRHRQAKNGLYAFSAGGRKRYPHWQFTGDAEQPVLPGLATIIPSFPSDMHPASVQNIMTNEQRALAIDEQPVTPVEWLRSGGAPEKVAAIFESFLQS